MKKFDLSVGDRLVIGDTTICLEAKTGQRARLAVSVEAHVRPYIDKDPISMGSQRKNSSLPIEIGRRRN